MLPCLLAQRFPVALFFVSCANKWCTTLLLLIPVELLLAVGRDPARQAAGGVGKAESQAVERLRRSLLAARWLRRDGTAGRLSRRCPRGKHRLPQCRGAVGGGKEDRQTRGRRERCRKGEAGRGWWLCWKC